MYINVSEIACCVRSSYRFLSVLSGPRFVSMDQHPADTLPDSNGI